jgi:hypothetical protein
MMLETSAFDPAYCVARSGRKKARISSANAAGVSSAGKCPPARHLGPALDISIGLFRKRAGRRQNLAGMFGISGRHHDLFADRNDPWAVAACVVWPETRIDRARQPIEHDIGEKHIAAEMSVDVAIAIAPAAKLLDDPRGEADGRVGERVGERLRPGTHDRRIAGLLL